MNHREALKLALEALEEINKLSIGENAICLPAGIDTAMDAIKQVLAQPEPAIDKSAAIRIATSLGWEPKRAWVGLTDEEVYQIYGQVEKKVGDHWEAGGITMMFPTTLYQALEAKLKEKNT